MPLYTLQFDFLKTRTPLCFHDPRCDPESYIAFSCHFFSILKYFPQSLSFMTLTFLKTTGQVICRMSLNLGWSDVFSPLDWGYLFSARLPQSGCILLSTSCQQVHTWCWHILSLMASTSVSRLRFLPGIPTIISLLPVIVRKYLGGDTSRLCKCSVSP